MTLQSREGKWLWFAYSTANLILGCLTFKFDKNPWIFLHFSWTLGSLYVMTRFYPNMQIELYWSWKIICRWRSSFGDSTILIASSSFIVNWSGLIKLSSNLFHPAFVIFIPSLQYYHHRRSIWFSHFWYKPVSSLPNP